MTEHITEHKNMPPINLPRTFTLNNGVQLPRLGFGTFRAQGTEVKEAVKAAIKLGIRHIDTAAIYQNEHLVAQGIAESGVPREQIFITTKISPYQQGTDLARAACEERLRNLNTEYVDLVLIHWPGVSKVPLNSPINAEKRWETWCVLEDYYKRGVFKSIGVSNYEVSHLSELLEKASVKPAVNQFEVHPRRPCNELRAACKQAGVAVVAYASLGEGDLITNPVVQRLARRVSKTPAQVLLRWALQKECVIIPKSVRPERIAEFTEASLLTWELGQQDMAELDSLADGHKYCWDPAGVQ